MKKRWHIKMMNYEYWPMWAFYLPLLPIIFVYGLYQRHFFFFTNANPGIDRFGGFFFDSKNKIDTNIPSHLRPKTILVKPFKEILEINQFLSNNYFDFPLILKPDAGERGKGVIKLNSINELLVSLQNIEGIHLIQEFVKHPLEYGVFISYLPNENRFKVISLTEKKFFTVIGNGIDPIEQLILMQDRGRVFYKQIIERSNYDMKYIPTQNEICIIHALGNHCNGTEFINRNDWISKELDDSMNLIMENLSGINYGRFDIKVDSYQNLVNLKNLKIIEFNGITAEPTHIYDNSYGYLKSLVSFLNTWKYLYNISKYNKSKGIKPAKHSEMLRKFILRYR